MAYRICDGAHRYIPRDWATEAEARRELVALLRPYPRGHEWRRRLSVQFAEAPQPRRRTPTMPKRQTNEVRRRFRAMRRGGHTAVFIFWRHLWDDVRFLLERTDELEATAAALQAALDEAREEAADLRSMVHQRGVALARAEARVAEVEGWLRVIGRVA
jgi:predicted DNA-binding ribbon-helix-helix protein